jgi:hypothetical protein
MNICCAAPDREQRTWVHDLPCLCRTGDVVLFSSNHSASNVTKVFTASEWDHVGIVVRPEPGRMYLFEWAGGLHLTNLVGRLTSYFRSDGRVIAIRRLVLGAGRSRSQFEEDLEAFVDMMLNVRAPEWSLADGRTLMEMIEAVRHQFVQPFAACTSGRRSSLAISAPPVDDDFGRLFCSKLVALSLKSAGLLAPSRRAADLSARGGLNPRQADDYVRPAGASRARAPLRRQPAEALRDGRRRLPRAGGREPRPGAARLL